MDLSNNLHVLAVRPLAEAADRNKRASAEYQRASAERRSDGKPVVQGKTRSAHLLDVIA